MQRPLEAIVYYTFIPYSIKIGLDKRDNYVSAR